MLTLLLCIREKDETLYRKVINGNFNEVDAKGKNICFIDHLCRRYKFSNENSHSTIIQHFEPTKIIDCLYSGNFNCVKNTYENKVYECSLDKYIDTIFSYYFSITSNIYSSEMHFVDEEITQIQIKENELANLLFNTHIKTKKFEIGFAWLEYTRLVTIGETCTPGYYKDLVELASALDWIDSDD